jgi:hypothetical protein
MIVKIPKQVIKDNAEIAVLVAQFMALNRIEDIQEDETYMIYKSYKAELHGSLLEQFDGNGIIVESGIYYIEMPKEDLQNKVPSSLTDDDVTWEQYTGAVRVNDTNCIIQLAKKNGTIYNSLSFAELEAYRDIFGYNNFLVLSEVIDLIQTSYETHEE